MALNKKRTKNVVATQVYRTEDLDQFKLLTGNRNIAVSKKLRDSIKAHGVVTPIKVNKRMEVKDGQHRLAVARELNIPIDYIFDTSEISVAELNSTSKPWKLGDYINQYATMGQIDFINLASLLKKYPALRPRVTISQALGFTNNGGSEVENVKNGVFSFKNFTAFSEYALSYQNFIDRTGLKTNQQLQTIYFILYSLNAFDDARFTKKVLTRGLPESLYGVTSLSRILRAFVEANNSGLSSSSKNWISISSDETGTIRVLNPHNTSLITTIAPVQTK